MRYSILIFVLLIAEMVSAQSANKNYILFRHYKQTGSSANDVGKVAIQVDYVDGLGRPLQQVQVAQTPSGSDLIQVYAFDAFGRQVKQYLPFAGADNGAFQSNADAALTGFYTANTPSLDAGDLGRPFLESGFELSPLNRPLSMRPPGNKSAPANIVYGTNSANEVKRYDYVGNANLLATVAGNGSYAAATLDRIQQTDEDGKVTVEFHDKQQRLICRQAVAAANETLSTYYVYDDFGQLRAVLQPQFQDNANLADYAFLYEYDLRGRHVAIKKPGSGVVNLVYDNYDRQVLSQDAEQLAKNVWGFTKYDALNRAIFTGELPSALNRTSWQASLDASQAHHEDKQGAGLGYTINNTLPGIVESNILTVQYHDDYTFPKPASLGYVNTFGSSALTIVKGFPTGSRARVLGGSLWLATVTYYDAEYRAIQNVRELYDLGAGALERTSFQYKYDLAPVLAEEKTEQVTATGTNTHVKTFEYDHVDRLLSVKEKLINGNEVREAVTIAQRYNALGQLQHRWFHSENASHFRRRTTYSNNIRGWLTQAKTFYKAKENGADSLFYNFALAYANGNNYTNGNISQMQWSGKAENAFTKGISLNYDGANRLTGSAGLYNYKEIETGITYDKGGNLKTLSRGGKEVDNLVYTYAGNRVSAIADNSGNNTGLKSGNSTYSYDANGNLIADGNRGATLTYNYLNLPKTITTGGMTFTYDYDAAGTKHKYVEDTLTVKYAGNFEYNQNNVLKRLSVTEGQVVYRKDSLRFDYFLKDHVGNIRVVFDEKGHILQQTDYYPFGLPVDRNNPVQTPAARNNVNRQTFLGRESQVGTGLIDLQARFYDPLTGRFTAVDPATEGQENQSPYQYAWNNPILRSDPTGERPGKGSNTDFVIANLIATAFFDAKHAIINTGARLLGSNLRAGYKVENGREVFETQIVRQADDQSLSGQAKEIVSAVADVAMIASAGLSPGNPGNLLSKTSVESQVVKAGKEVVNEAGKAVIKTASGTDVTGFVKHGINRIIERGLKPNAILDALKNPLRVGQVVTDATGRESQRFIGRFGSVVVNPRTGKIISANPTSTQRAANLLRKSKEQ